MKTKTSFVYYVVSTGKYLPTFRMFVVLSPSSQIWLFDPDTEGNTILRTFGSYLPVNKK
jgi:hypothetical protein